MDIKIGFSDSPRELVITSTESRELMSTKIAAALNNSKGVLELEDDKGSRYLVRNERIAYVEIGSATTRQVGFAGA
ncbi:MAG: DUF3107 domain-containing protein [Corynebacterium matruchotii]|jgi:hypothetical protein|uniref:ATP-binding protein n=2 Tax=Corynebacterium matruchotii TaxID=43768 RepID=E0DD73_9CORY|nr:DUF3107 domain-containing protein [Corynebacterium matruchotii]RKW20235.1 MAG: DUF3107 domain-containing protein [Corynebacterium sp.]EFM49810.1 hypothetical protein HMPREF0299_6273 [Corynebacterium matruchotii ATCC 14266]KAB1924188.1 DUF3107 domain-containing protein [Corynebacterium matruchotii]QIP45833.1 DUF3107 domain-containing protein [Corynebacterium matruchotii]SPW23848.1 Protein of uncharacterised function (DUF3107) [Corynebacterium matruchotii]